MIFKYLTTSIQWTGTKLVFATVAPGLWNGALFRQCACERKSSDRWVIY